MHPLAVLLVIASTAIHASWNLAAHSRPEPGAHFLRALILISVVALPVTVGLALLGPGLPGSVWALALAAAACMALYFLGLGRGYRAGDFTVVYPVGRGLPVALLALIDVFRGEPPSPAGWLGIALVAGGCLAIAGSSGQAATRGATAEATQGRAGSATIGWTVVTALAGTGYSAIDKLAADQLVAFSGGASPLLALGYGLLEYLLATPLLAMALLVTGDRVATTLSGGSWRTPARAGVGIVAAYSLVLWAFQLAPQASYVVALRQLSIVMGVVVGVVLLKERAPLRRLVASVVITAGVACVGLVG